jgi:hypothetical protein
MYIAVCTHTITHTTVTTHWIISQLDAGIRDAPKERKRVQVRLHPLAELFHVGDRVQQAALGEQVGVRGDQFLTDDATSACVRARARVIARQAPTRHLFFFFLKCGSGNKKNIFVNWAPSVALTQTRARAYLRFVKQIR